MPVPPDHGTEVPSAVPDPATFAKGDDAARPTEARAAGAADLPVDDPVPPPSKLPVALRARLACQDALSGWILPRCGIEPRTLAAAGVVLAIAVGFAAHHYWTGRPQDVTPGDAPAVAVSAPDPTPTSASGPPTEPAPGTDPDQTVDPLLVVDVAGDVVEPGLRTLPPGSRVGDAIDAAGGPTPGTETTLINRARPLTDGEHILVGGASDAVDAGTAPAPPLPGFDSQGKIRLNTATADDLEELPGVGPVLAGNIVAHREQHGPFTSVDQLIAVSGIGETRLADLRDRVVL